jgi:hypothetical protein
MKIISPFKDYYDYIQAWGKEPGIVYNRKEQSLIDGEVFEDFQRVRFGSYFTGRANSYPFLLGFCGRIIPAFKEYIVGGTKTRFVWGEEAREIILKYCRRDHSMSNLVRFVENPTKVLDDLFAKYQVPVFRINWRHVVLNPCLKEFEFDMYMPADQAFQEISTFIGTELKEKMVASPMTNREKVSSHGFDKKSFRKEK